MSKMSIYVLLMCVILSITLLAFRTWENSLFQHPIVDGVLNNSDEKGFDDSSKENEDPSEEMTSSKEEASDNSTEESTNYSSESSNNFSEESSDEFSEESYTDFSEDFSEISVRIEGNGGDENIDMKGWD